MGTRKHSRNTWTAFSMTVIASELEICTDVNRHIPHSHQINRIHKTWGISKEWKMWHALARKPMKTKSRRDVQTLKHLENCSCKFSFFPQGWNFRWECKKNANLHTVQLQRIFYQFQLQQKCFNTHPQGNAWSTKNSGCHSKNLSLPILLSTFTWQGKTTTGTAKDRVLGKTKTFTRRQSRWMDFKTVFISHYWEMLKLKNHSSTSVQGFMFFFYRRNESYWLMQLLVFWRRLMGPLSFCSPCHICWHYRENEPARSNTSVLNHSDNRHTETSLLPHHFFYAKQQVSRGGLHICLAVQKRKL